MACRIGITTDPEERLRYWRIQHPLLRNWQIIGTHWTKSSAQQQENTEALRLGCVAQAGGSGPEAATWYVYYFEY